MIVVAGDALADMVGDAELRYQALPGGSCFNVPWRSAASDTRSALPVRFRPTCWAVCCRGRSPIPVSTF